MPKLNIYAQPTYHEDAWIVGNLAGLAALRDAINAAIAMPGAGQSIAQVFATDGEGYRVIVQNVVDDDQLDSLAQPFQVERPPCGFWPWQIFATRRASVEGMAEPPETSDDRSLRRALGVPMFKEDKPCSDD